MSNFLGINKRLIFSDELYAQSSSDGLFKPYSEKQVFGNNTYPNLNIGENAVWNELLVDKYEQDIGTPFSIWSCARRLWSQYKGSLIEVRRSSDNATQNIGFNPVNQQLDTVALINFLGTNSGFVRTLYDQSGRGNHFVQTVLAEQPRIYNAGVLQTANGLPTMFFDGINDKMVVSNSTATYKFIHDTTDGNFEQYVFIVAQNGFNSNPARNMYMLCNNNSTTSAVGFDINYDDVTGNNLFVASIMGGASGFFAAQIFQANIIIPNRLNVLGIYKTYNTALLLIERMVAYYNRDKPLVNNFAPSYNNIGQTNPSNANATTNLFLGSVNATNVALTLGYISEVIIYRRSVFDNKNLTSLQNDICSFYGVI